MRLGEALLYLGDGSGARAQLEAALELAHVSLLAEHLLFLVYGVLLEIPDEGAGALARDCACRDAIRPALGLPHSAQPAHPLAAATVCARAGQLERGREFLERAEHGAGSWAGGPWQAAVTESRAELLLAEGDQAAAADALRGAAEGYAVAGRLLNERRARDTVERLGQAEDQR